VRNLLLIKRLRHLTFQALHCPPRSNEAAEFRVAVVPF